MDTYEKLGVFYLGREFDPETGQTGPNPILYDSKDLCTHAVIVGMTGSGKTGLGIGLLEEALIDNIPVIAVDPKGDLTNLLLTFPDLQAADFLPWVNPQAALAAGQTPEQHAAGQAKLWTKGLADWDQGPERIARLKAAAEVAVYTPGSSAGLPVNVLRSFNPPDLAIREDLDLWRESVKNTASSLLALLGLDADPLTSREHILLANILENLWAVGESPDLAALIRAIQEPPFQRIGVMDLDSFFPARDRFSLAMKLNGLLAAPGFEAWLEGAPLDFGRLLQTAEGRPRASIFTISHLGDAERMFFVSMLLNQALAWMRTQPGTSSLRALLYIDEIFGYFPPVKNPPSKEPLLTLLKQARAFGLGVVLATQNPVDLDYKGLSNAGTWFVGRLQAERDKERLLAGLEGAASGQAFDRARLDNLISGLDKRVFLLHNVHDRQPQIFQTRWTLSYLPGPMTREQIKGLKSLNQPAGTATVPVPSQGAMPPPPPGRPQPDDRPVLPPGLADYYLTASGAGLGLIYYPSALARVAIHYVSAKHKLSLSRTLTLAGLLEDGPRPLDWDQALAMATEPGHLTEAPLTGAGHAALPGPAARVESYKKWQSDLARWVRQNRPLVLLNSPRLGLTSRPDETEGQFRARLAQVARETRDLAAEKLRRKYESKFNTLQDRLRRAEQATARETEQVQARKLDTAVSFGTAVLGAFFGRKVVSATNAGRLGTAVKSAGRTRKDMMDVARAKETAAAVRAQLADLEAEFQNEVNSLNTTYDPAGETLEEIRVAAKSTDIAVEFFGLVWLPFRRDNQGRLTPDWV
jgi:hypothetical protein